MRSRDLTSRLFKEAAALLLLAGAPAIASAPDVVQITWLQGYANSSGASATEIRMSGELLAFLGAGWPQVEHTIVQASPRRAWQQIAQGEHVCQPASVRTAEREKLAYFTDTLLGPPMQLIARRDKLPQLPRKASGDVDLERLLADRQLRGALIDGRSYGSYIDAILARQQAASSTSGSTVTRYAASDYGSQIFSMLSLGRADYTIGYDAFLSQIQAEEPRGQQLASQAIAGADQLVRAGIACPRTPWGLAAIRGIDRVLGTPAGSALLKNQALHWLTPEARQRYGAQFDAFYRERAKPSVIR